MARRRTSSNEAVNQSGTAIATESDDYRLFSVIKNSESKRAVDDAIVSLWKKYRPAINAHRTQLRRMTESYVNPLDSDVFEDYIDESFETFMKAVNIIDLNKVQHIKGTWTFYICLSGYLQAHNRTIMTDHLRRCQNEISEGVVFDADGEEISMFDLNSTAIEKFSPDSVLNQNETSNILQTAISSSYAKFTELQKDIWELKLRGLSKSELSDRLNVSSNDITRNFKQMKRLMKAEIAEYSARSRILNVHWV